jgi:hypothetical protein
LNTKVLNVFFRVYIEWTFATMIFLVLHLLSSQQLPLFTTMTIVGIGGLVFAILLEKKGDLAKPLYFLLVMPSLYLAGLLTGLKIFYLTIMALFIFWRTLKHYEDSTGHSESKWLVLTFLIGVFISPLAHFHGDQYLNQIAFLLTFQLLFIFSGQFFIKLIDNEIISKRKFVMDFAKLLGLGLFIMGVITFGRNFIKEGFFMILQAIGWIFTMILYPIFSWVENPILKERASRLLSSRMPGAKEYESPFADIKQTIDANFWGPILFAAVGLLVFYYLYKKTNLFNKEAEQDVSISGYITTSSLNDSMLNAPFYKKASGKPVDQIRNEIYQLEKFAYKKDLARLNHEAITEWLNRLGINYDDRTVNTYELVRYGDSVNHEVEDWFKEEIKSIKNQLTIIQKERKDANKAGVKDSLKNVFKRK